MAAAGAKWDFDLRKREPKRRSQVDFVTEIS